MEAGNINLPLIKTENLTFDYNSGDEKKEENPAVKDINLAFEKGSFTAVLGHNGSGKSTLAKLLNAVLTPTSGKVFVNGLDTSDEENLFSIRQKVGMVFQNPDNQLVATIVEEEVAFGPENIGVPPKEIRERVDHALETVGMENYKLHSPHQLSGGQKQRIAIASVLAMRPDCIIFDESTAMLDPQGREDVLRVIKELNDKNKMTSILITHYMDEAVMADRVVAMNKGTVYLDGTPSQVFSHVEKIKKIGLDIPQAAELFYMLDKENPSGLTNYTFPPGILDVDGAADILEAYLK